MTPPRVFPFPLRIGTDVCRISRIHDILTTRGPSRAVNDGPPGPPSVAAAAAANASPVTTAISATGRGARFIHRLLAPEERGPAVLAMKARAPLAYALGCPAGGDTLARGAKGRDDMLWRAATFLAGRFAAKEAAIKAHPRHRLSFHDIVITSSAAGSASILTMAADRQRRREQHSAGEQEVLAGQEGGRDFEEDGGSGPPVAIVTLSDREGVNGGGTKSVGSEGQLVRHEALISISHDGDYATAVCLAYDDGAMGKANIE